MLAASFLHTNGVVMGATGSGTLTFGGELSVEIAVDTRLPACPWIELRHESRSSDGDEQRYFVHLTTTRPHFGGQRWWFLCPRTGRRVGKLYLPLGGHRFLSRQAYGLGYASQRGSAVDRAQLRAMRLHRALEGDGSWIDDVPDKPKGMHWRTYARLVAELSAARERWDALASPLLLDRLHKLAPGYASRL